MAKNSANVQIKFYQMVEKHCINKSVHIMGKNIIYVQIKLYFTKWKR